MTHIPCRNCITLPICKATASRYETVQSSTNVMILTYLLQDKCKLVKDFWNLKDTDLLFELYDDPKTMYKINQVLTILKGEVHE